MKNVFTLCLAVLVAIFTSLSPAAQAHPFPDEPVEVYYHGHYIQAWYHYHQGLHKADIPGYGEMWIRELLPDE